MKLIVDLMDSASINHSITLLAARRDELLGEKPVKQKADKPAKAKEETAAPAVTDDQLNAALTALIAAHGRDKAVEVLGNFGVKKAKEIATEKRADLLKALTDAAAAPKDEGDLL